LGFPDSDFREAVVCECCNTRDYEIKPLCQKQHNSTYRSKSCCEHCHSDARDTQKSERDQKESSGVNRTFVRKRQKSESSTSAVVELTKSYCKCSNSWVKENMGKVMLTCVVVMVVCISGGILVLASPKYDSQTTTNVNYILPQSGIHVDDSTKAPTVYAQRDLSVSLVLFYLFPSCIWSCLLCLHLHWYYVNMALKLPGRTSIYLFTCTTCSLVYPW